MAFRILISSVVFMLFLSGCVGKREINDLALVMAVAIDKVKDSNKVEVTIEASRPADARGQTGAPAGNTGDPVWSVSAQGETLFEAIRNLANISTRRIFWAHNFIIVINEDVAKDGIADIIDFFTRNPELRMRTWIAITPDKAKEVISTMTGLEVIPAEALNKLFRYTKVSAVAPQTELLDVQAAYLGEMTHPVIARLQLIERGVSNKKEGQAGAFKQVELEGAGVFKGDKLVGILNKDETRGMLPFIEKIDSGAVVLSCPDDSEQLITAEIKYQNFNVTPQFKEGNPAFEIDLQTITNIVEAGCPFSVEDKEQVQKLEKQVEEKMKSDIEAVLTKAQNEYKADFLELGQRFNNQFPAEWKDIQDNWDSTFSEVTIKVKAEAEIKSGVLLYNPTRSGKK